MVYFFQPPRFNLEVLKSMVLNLRDGGISREISH